MSLPSADELHWIGIFLNLSGAIAVIVATVIGASLFKKVFNHYILTSSEHLRVDFKQYTFLRYFIASAIYIAGFALAIHLIPGLRNLSISIFAGSGIFAAAIGFAAQNSIANIVSGIFITIFKPFRVGDRIKLTGKEMSGVVEDITLRHTIIKTYENKRVIVPNSVISTEVLENSNLIDDRICRLIEIGISYDSDVDKAMAIMREEALKHPDCIDGRNEEEILSGAPQVMVRLISFGDSSVNLRAWVWSKDQPTGFAMECDLNKSIKRRFDTEGIEIPFPHRTIVYKNSPKP
ncbi:MAG: mechanosensitive ion channel family protein [Candidatus Omnitrophica bacterium]|nr:mechanosensitive ion channel family protein [Candidatus Omnitrophota bacterium]